MALVWRTVPDGRRCDRQVDVYNSSSVSVCIPVHPVQISVVVLQRQLVSNIQERIAPYGTHHARRLPPPPTAHPQLIWTITSPPTNSMSWFNPLCDQAFAGDFLSSSGRLFTFLSIPCNPARHFARAYRTPVTISMLFQRLHHI